MNKTQLKSIDGYIDRRENARKVVSRIWWTMVGLVTIALVFSSISGCSKYGDGPVTTVGSVKYKNCTIDKVDVPGANEYLYVGICENTVTVNNVEIQRDDANNRIYPRTKATVIQKEGSE